MKDSGLETACEYKLPRQLVIQRLPSFGFSGAPILALVVRRPSWCRCAWVEVAGLNQPLECSLVRRIMLPRPSVPHLSASVTVPSCSESFAGLCSTPTRAHPHLAHPPPGAKRASSFYILSFASSVTSPPCEASAQSPLHVSPCPVRLARHQSSWELAGLSRFFFNRLGRA